MESILTVMNKQSMTSSFLEIVVIVGRDSKAILTVARVLASRQGTGRGACKEPRGGARESSSYVGAKLTVVVSARLSGLAALVGVKGYGLWDSNAHKLVISRDIIFNENLLQQDRETSSSNLPKMFKLESLKEIQNQSEEQLTNTEGDETDEEHTKPGIETQGNQRRPKRTTDSPIWLKDYVTAYACITEEHETCTYREAYESNDVSQWSKFVCFAFYAQMLLLLQPEAKVAKLFELSLQTPESAEECIQANYHGTNRVTEALLPILQLSHSPRIVNVSSTFGRQQALIQT
ncbi:hypothetical protein NE237_008382 [Protea cynaroides]|uniref:Uncharacterized protein n=1 Tax=Protea cynaroides TaxID=273540 RepID=A0A9Q0KVI4_9MAGN|nr:hypothetical protein NE237_008382 [Protea cynaroides]